MKKIFNLVLCLLMLISFTNIAKIFAEEETLSVQDVVNHYMDTNYMQGILQANQIEEYEENLHLEIDETNHKINIINHEDVLVSFDYTDEYIAYNGIVPEITEDFDSNEAAFDDYDAFKYAKGFLISIFDLMGYTELDENLEEEEYDEEFYNQYGWLQTYDELTLPGEDEPDEYLKEIRVSLNKAKIQALLDTYGTQREDYIKTFSPLVETPEIKVIKKNATLYISWEDDYRAYRYVLYRSDKKDGKYTSVASYWRDDETDEVNLSYTDRNVKYGNPYYYKLLSIGDYNREYSTIKGKTFIPQQVMNVTAGSIKTDSIKISWDRQVDTGYVIYRSTNNKTWKAIKTITKNTTLSYNDTKLSPYKRYYYKVRAYKQVGRKRYYGKYSEVITAVTAPAKPAFKVASNTYESLKLNITAVKGATKYIVYRSTSLNGTYERIADITTTSYTDSGLTLGRTYYYRVRGCSRFKNCGSMSNKVSAKVIIKAPSVTLTVSKSSPVTIKVGGLSATEGYEIWRSTSLNGTYKMIKDSSVDETSYQDAEVKKGTRYYYKVRSYVYVNGNKKYSSYTSKNIRAL